MKAMRSLRALLAAALLLGVAAASVVDGRTADLVAGGDGEWFARWVETAAALAAPDDSRSQDPYARLVSSCPPPLPPALTEATTPTRRAPTPTDPVGSSLADREPRTPRAPPLG